MSLRKKRIAGEVGRFEGGPYDPHYLAYFDCFNRGLYYEAHEVLEDLWLGSRNEQNGNFYKGLIQLAGAFVHLQKDRTKPAAALLKLAGQNLAKYGEICQGLDPGSVQRLIRNWLAAIELKGFEVNPLFETGVQPPKLQLTV